MTLGNTIGRGGGAEDGAEGDTASATTTFGAAAETVAIV